MVNRGKSPGSIGLEAVEFKWGDPIGFQLGYSLSLLQMTAPGDRMTATEEGRRIDLPLLHELSGRTIVKGGMRIRA